MLLTSSLLNSVVAIAHRAGEKIISLYDQKIVVIADKKDGSPLTKADLIAHQTIFRELKKITPNIPILSEESTEEDVLERRKWQCLWLIDPLDGTKEFIDRTGEFTVNIALIVNHRPVLGVVHAPALNITYFAMDGDGAYKKTNERVERIFCSSPPRMIRVAASHRHAEKRLQKFLQKLPEYTLIKVGSALKICLIAEGAADLYPCLGPTYEWDTAAGQAILNNADGVLHDSRFRPFQYNKRSTLLNGCFIVSHKDAHILIGFHSAALLLARFATHVRLCTLRCSSSRAPSRKMKSIEYRFYIPCGKYICYIFSKIYLSIFRPSS